MQQIIISGVGGQGVLYITRVLAEAALVEDRHVLISETHGMAQRGGNVISHLKVGGLKIHNAFQNEPAKGNESGFEFSSPLIRPGRADILLALHPDGLQAHGYYLKADGKKFCNEDNDASRYSINAVRIASELNSPLSANLVLLGFVLGSGELFCQHQQVENALKQMGGKRVEINLRALHAGLKEAEQKLAQ